MMTARSGAPERLGSRGPIRLEADILHRRSHWPGGVTTLLSSALARGIAAA